MIEPTVMKGDTEYIDLFYLLKQPKVFVDNRCFPHINRLHHVLNHINSIVKRRGGTDLEYTSVHLPQDHENYGTRGVVYFKWRSL